ncbi:MAG: DUF4255 domain-containing protein [Bacteroidota bacterium]
MIRQALFFVQQRLNAYFKQLYGLSEDKAILSYMVAPDGSIPNQNTDKVIINLTNIEHETNVYSRKGYTQSSPDQVLIEKPPIDLNLYVLFAAHFADYQESLKFLSDTIAFFQTYNSFTHHNSPSLDPNIHKLIFEIDHKLDYQEINYLWGVIGAKYQPSVHYKVRMLSIRMGELEQVIPTIQQVEEDTQAFRSTKA